MRDCSRAVALVACQQRVLAAHLLNIRKLKRQLWYCDGASSLQPTSPNIRAKNKELAAWNPLSGTMSWVFLMKRMTNICCTKVKHGDHQ
jgi:hypothetical protein